MKSARPFQPFVVWFTGLSGSGKTTLADGVLDELRRRGIKAERLDGDELRRRFPGTGYTRPEREKHVLRAAELASALEKKGVCAVVSLISPYAGARQSARGLCRNFVEVHVSAPLAVCETRDPKGLYAKARKGGLKSFTGIDDPYEVPMDCEVSVDTSALTKARALAKVMDYLGRYL